ncbi:MAG: lamin tail domain-containing protein, partial [Clostridia bacterium]|nr:lamin tail domain-containing protein [Clostridia bacterium]
AASERGAEVRWLVRGDAVPLGDTGAALRVLAPTRLFTDKDDNNSLVLMLETAQGRALLTGDMELPEEAALLAEGDDLNCTILKAPNHGDDDTVSEVFANACRAQAALISTDSQEKPGTPDPGVVSRLMAAGTACYVTQDAGLGLRATLSGGQATVEYVNIDVPAADGVAIESVVPGADTVTLYNSGAALDLTGWSLYSDRGDELYLFPDGYVLPAGGRVTVGTRSSDGGYDLLWDDKKVVHKSKTDDIALYDAYGRAVDVMSNGL